MSNVPPSTTAAKNQLLILKEALAKGTEFLTAKGIATARLDAELLVAEALGISRLGLYLDLERPLVVAERDRARELLRRRGLREPVAYILGRREFLSLDFQVDARVLIPRPETELLVERVLEELPKRFPDAEGQYRILELGIGSGAIAVSLAKELPQAQVLATEISPGAAEVAQSNAIAHGVADRVEIRVQADFAGIDGLFHAIVSNPPYIDGADRDNLPADVRDFEPAQALFAEEQGLACYKFLTGDAGRLLETGGFLITEIGMGQAPAITLLAEAGGLRIESVIKDYAGIDRHLLMGRKA